MKMYEKLGMSIEDALKWISECQHRDCKDCPAVEGPKGSVSALCALLSEVQEPPKVRRWQAAKTQEDFERFYTDFRAFCNPADCASCKYKNDTFTADCYHDYLSELVDAPESEDDND